MKIKILFSVFLCLVLISCAVWDLPKKRQNYVELNTWISPEIKEAILAGRIILGMTPQQVIASRGKPLDINRTTERFGIHEQWVYVGIEVNERLQLSKKEMLLDHEFAYIYFENGKVTSWQSR